MRGRVHFTMWLVAMVLLMSTGVISAEEAKPRRQTIDITPSSEERSSFELANEAREERGLKPLVYCPRLSAVARAHARDMIAEDYFGHVDRDGHSVAFRLREAGIGYSRVAENLAGHADVYNAHEALMEGRGHRAAILGNYHRMGIGVVEGGPYGYMIVQMFAAGTGE
ncbi:MAG: CAP domain-containing protein [Clostridia bacterium]